MRQFHDAIERALSLRVDMRFLKNEDIHLANPVVLDSHPNMAWAHHVRFHAWPTVVDHGSPRFLLDGLETGISLFDAYDYDRENSSHSVNIYVQSLGKIGMYAVNEVEPSEMLRLVELRMSSSRTSAEFDAGQQMISAFDAVASRLPLFVE